LHVESVVVDHLVKRYGKLLAVKNLSFKAREGEVTGILGPNGAGKTTTLRAIAGALRPTRGSVTVYGYNSFREASKVKRMVGVMPEVPSLFPELSIRDNLEFLGKLYGLKGRNARIRAVETASIMGLDDYLDTKYGHLSKGLKRRADMAGALIHDSRVIILDEPTAGLDVLSSSHLRKIIRSLVGEGRTIILSSHYIDEVMELSDKIIILYKGTKVYEGEPSKLRNVLDMGKRVKIRFNRPLSNEEWRDIISTSSGLVRGDLLYRRDYLEAYTLDPLEYIDTVRDRTKQLGVKVVDLDIIPPSWEDVFKKYIGQTNRARGGCTCGAV
jgi:ABC-type multidrug transport system ATPase subunit